MIKRQFIPSYLPSRGTCKVIWHAFRLTLMQRVKMKCSFDNWSQYNVCKGINNFLLFFYFYFFNRKAVLCSFSIKCLLVPFFSACISIWAKTMSWQIPLSLLHNWHNWVAQISTAKPVLPVESITISTTKPMHHFSSFDCPGSFFPPGWAEKTLMQHHLVTFYFDSQVLPL